MNSRIEQRNQKDLKVSLIIAQILIAIFIISFLYFFFNSKQYIQGVSSALFFCFLFYYIRSGYKDLSKVDSLNIIVKYIFIVVIFLLVTEFPKLLDISSYFSIALIVDAVVYLVKIYWHRTGQIKLEGE